MAKLDADQFFSSLKKLYDHWKKDDSETNKIKPAKILTIIFGNNKNDIYAKSSSVHKWMFGYELTDTVLIFTKATCHIVTSKKKVDFLQELNENKENKSDDTPKIVLHTKSKGDNSDLMSKIKDFYHKGKVGVLLKDLKNISVSTEFSSDVVKLLPDSSDQIDISSDLGQLMAPKSLSELNTLKRSSQVTSNIYNKVYKHLIMSTIDKEKKVKHTKLANEVENSVSDREKTGVVPDLLESAYPPIIQSGGNFALKFSAQADETNLHFGVIVCMLGMRYRSYCSNIARVLMVNPSDSITKNYEKLLNLHEQLLNLVKPGKKCCEVYEEIIEKCPEKFRNNLTKNFGSVIGIEFKDTSLTISSKCQGVIKQNMVFNLSIGFQNLENKEFTDPKDKNYSLFLADTVEVTSKNDENTIFTKDVKRKLKSVKILISEEDTDEDDDEVEINEGGIYGGVDTQKFGRGMRNSDMKTAIRDIENNEKKRQEKQQKLLEKMNEDAYERLTKGENGNADSGITKKLPNCYESAGQLPWSESDIQNNKLSLDKKREAILVPVGVQPVPIHVSMVKNFTPSVEGDWEYLRVNLYHPGSTLGRTNGSNFHYPDNVFLKEVIFRASVLNGHNQNLQTCVRLFRELQKKYRTKEQEEKEKKGLVKQDKLLVNPNFRGARLKDLYMSPNLGQKRIPGILEAHSNGFRYQTIRQDRVDILYNNIKHAIFQPCDHEMIMVLHFKLKNFILMNKRKVNDIRFYIEVGEITTDLMKSSNIRDRDDIYAEQMEREHRHKLKSGFKNFIDRVEGFTREIEFDSPFRELGFYGVPGRVNCLLQPTTSCLINVTEWPAFVVSLDEIECVHFERVSFSIKNFDMVIIYKDYTRKVDTICSIPRKSLENIKSWLNSCNLRYTEGVQSLNWAKVMSTIVTDPEGFFSQGGWKFLDTNNDADSEDEELEKEEDEDFEEPESDTQSGSDDDDSDEEDYTDADSDEETGSDFSGSEVESDQSEGKDWDELEAEAKRADKQRGDYSEEEEEDRRSRGKKSKKSKHHQSAPPSKKRRR